MPPRAAFAGAAGVIILGAIAVSQLPAKNDTLVNAVATQSLQDALTRQAELRLAQINAAAPKADKAILPLLAAAVPPQITLTEPTPEPEKIPLPKASPRRLDAIKNTRIVKTPRGDIPLPAMFAVGKLSSTTLMAYGEIYNASQQVSRSDQKFFSTLMLIAKKESNFNLKARGNGSSAGGLFQITDETIIDLCGKNCEKHGYTRFSGAYRTSLRGKPYLYDRAMRQEILNARDDAKFASLMAAERVYEIYGQLKVTYPTRTIGGGAIYAHYFFGSGAGPKFLNAVDTNPRAIGASLFPHQAAALGNRNIFYSKFTGKARSVGEIYALFDHHFKPYENLITVAVTQPEVWASPPAHFFPPSKAPSVVYAKPDPITSPNLFSVSTSKMRDLFNDTFDRISGNNAATTVQAPVIAPAPAPANKPF